jgi:DNA modification methylase
MVRVNKKGIERFIQGARPRFEPGQIQDGASEDASTQLASSTAGLKRKARGGEKTRRLSLLAIDELKPNPRNPRRHTRAQVRALARSIEAFGFNAPILVDWDRNIVAGHGRYEAAKLLGLESVPVISLDHLTPTQARAYMLADNKLSDRSSWDETSLALHLKELSELALDFDFEAIGFEMPEVDFRIQSLDSTETADRADEFTAAEGPAVSALGDMWLLGKHRVHCADAADPAAYGALMEDEKAAAAFTDPPYNVRIGGNVCGSGSIQHREFAMAAGEMSPSEFTGFLTQALGLARANTHPGALIYVCMDWRHIGELSTAAQSIDCDTVTLCVWVKSNGGMGSLYRSRHELVFVFRNGKEPHLNNVQLGRFGRNRTNVWNYPGANGFPRKGRKRVLDLHPTVKPIAMVADAILDSTNLNDIVLDPFLGSGTTLLAAERTGRRCRAIELDPLYVDTTIQRWERLTGLQARDARGRAFAEIAGERRAAI